MANRARRAFGVLCVAVLVPSTAGCGKDEPDTVQVPETVQIVGDSLTNQANGNGGPVTENTVLLDALEDAGFDATGGGVDGAQVAGAYETMWSPELQPDILVIALGTNDMHDGRFSVAGVRSTLQDWLNDIPGTCVVFIEVNERTDAWALDRHGPEYNDMLRDLAEGHPEAHSVEWRPEPEMLLEDRIHLTESGEAAYRQLIVDGVERCSLSLASIR